MVRRSIFGALGVMTVLAVPTVGHAQAPGQVLSHQKISDTDGNFNGVLDDTDHFGLSVSNLGDLDGDGVIDLAVGAQQDDDGGQNRGAVWVLFLNTDGTVKSHQKISQTVGGFTGMLADGDVFGSVSVLGDLDGDGVTDLAVGAVNDDDGGAPPNANRGAVWVLFLNTNGTVKSHQKISDTEGNFTGVLDDLDQFGQAIAPLGDLDGDGVIDMAVGALRDDDEDTDAGAVWVLFLNTNGTVKSHQKISDTDGNFNGVLANGDNFGVSVSALGDLDGDGVTDMAVGAQEDDDGGINHGAVWVLFLNTNGTVKSHQKISDTDGNFTGVLDDDKFGASVSALGDVDGDAVTDLAVGALHDGDGGFRHGAMWILFLNDTGTVKSHQKISDTEGNFTGVLDDGDEFGVSASALGDLDGDGVTDLAVGAYLDDDGGILPNANRGAVWVLFLQGAGISFAPPLEVTAAGAANREAIGDLDGDGDPDVVIAIPDANPILPGSVQVFLNQGTDAVSGEWQGLVGLPTIAVGVQPSAIAVGFFDGDANLDIAVTNAADGDVSVLINNGDSPPTFTRLKPDIPVGNLPSAIAAGDFGEDLSGDIDLAVANEGDAVNNILILTNDGNANFTQAGAFTAGGAPVAIIADDLDDNKDLDMLVANRDTDDISVFLSAGGGSFGAPINLPLAVGAGPVDLATGDLDLDLNGTRDIITANNGDGTVSVILNNGGGLFDAAFPVPVGATPLSVEAVDLDGDSDLDLAVVADVAPIGPAVQVLENQLIGPGFASGGSGVVFAAPVAFSVGADPNFVVSVKLNTDEEVDLVTVNTVGATGGSVTALLNARCPPDIDGDGVVNVIDLIDLLLCFGQPAVPGCEAEDVNQDGAVNVLDLVELLLAFGTACP